MTTKELESLRKLVDLQKELKAKTIDKKLTQLDFYDRTSKLFKPITNTIEEQSTDINENLKALETALNQQNLKAIENVKPNLPILSKTNSLGELSKTWMLNQLKDGTLIFNSKPVVIKSGNISLIESNVSYPFTDNFKALIYGENVRNISNYDDLVNYLNFTNQAKSSTSAKRKQELLERISDLEKEHKGTGLKTIVIPNTIPKVKERLQVLLAARKSGHSNISLDELTALLDHLLEHKEITKEQYLKILHEK